MCRCRARTHILLSAIAFGVVACLECAAASGSALVVIGLPGVATAADARRSASSTYRLLLVEDDRDALVADAHLFENAGFVVELAKTASAGLAKVKAFRPDVIVTDLMMPDVSGEEFVRQLRRRRATRHTPVIVYTAVTDPAQLQRLVLLEVRSFAIKPCVPTVIAARARQLLAMRGERDVRVFTGYGEPLDELALLLRTTPG